MIPNGLPDASPQNQYIHTSEVKLYPFTFYINAPEQLELYYTAGMKDVKLGYVTDYDLTGVDRAEGGTVALTDEGFEKIPLGARLTLIRSPKYDQPMAFIENSALSAQSLTAGLNHVVFQTQDLLMKLKRAVLVPVGYEGEMVLDDVIERLQQTIDIAERIQSEMARAEASAVTAEYWGSAVQEIYGSLLAVAEIVNTIGEATESRLGLVRMASDDDIRNGAVDKSVRASQLKYIEDWLAQRATTTMPGIVQMLDSAGVQEHASIAEPDPRAEYVVRGCDLKHLPFGTINKFYTVYDLGGGGAEAEPQNINAQDRFVFAPPYSSQWLVIAEVLVNGVWGVSPSAVFAGQYGDDIVVQANESLDAGGAVSVPVRVKLFDLMGTPEPTVHLSVNSAAGQVTFTIGG